ncbi:MAG: hypothetical protein Q9216_002012 [Gyalolechia sp. 2 TL-2023]
MASGRLHRRRPRDDQLEEDGDSSRRQEEDLTAKPWDMLNAAVKEIAEASPGSTNVIQQVVGSFPPLERYTQSSAKLPGSGDTSVPRGTRDGWSLRWPLTIVALLWFIAVVGSRLSGRSGAPPSLGNLTQAPWQARLLMSETMTRTQGGRVSIEKMARGAKALRALESTVRNSAEPIQALLLDPIHEASLRHNASGNALKALHYSLVDYNASWPYHLVSLHHDIAVEKAAARDLLQRLWNVLTYWVAPPLYHNSDVELQKRLLAYSGSLKDDLDQIQERAMEYNGNVTGWNRAVAGIDQGVGQAIINYRNHRRDVAMRFTSIYLGLNRKEAKQLDGYIREIIRIDTLVCEATGSVEEIQQESAAVADDIMAINQRLQDWVDSCESGPKCNGLQDELLALNARVERLGPEYTM